MKHWHLLILALIFFPLYTVQALEEKEYSLNRSWPHSGISRPGEPPETHITLLGLTLGHHTIQDVEVKLGKHKHPVRADSHGKDYCYVAADKTDKTKVLFGTGVMGSGENLLNFTLLSGQYRLPKKHACKISLLVNKNLVVANGVTLGMTKEQVLKLLGPSTRELNEDLFFEYEAETKRNSIEGVACTAISSTIIATFSESRLVALLAAKIPESIECPKQK